MKLQADTENKWTMLNTIKWLTGYFEKKGLPEARLNAEHIIAHSLGIKRLDIYLQFEKTLTKDELSQLKPLIEKRAERVPLQHILGTQPFRNVDIKVSRDVLIPRPETELLVDEVLKYIDTDADLEIAELGAGSGAILTALASERKNIKLTGTEISAAAIKVADENIAGYKDRISINQGDLFEPLTGKKYDIIVSNPPYIPEEEWENLMPEVRDHEPKSALVGGKDGLDFYRRILNDAPNYLKKDGRIFLEIGDNQKDSVIKLAEDCCKYDEIEIKKDLNGKDRIFLAHLKLNK